MKDLYKRLGLPDGCEDESRIKQAIETHEAIDSHVGADARAVLLNARRKRVYDRSHRTLKRIARLRAELGLSNASNAEAKRFEDFLVVVADDTLRINYRKRGGADTSPRTEKPRWNSGGGAVLAALAVAAFIVGAIFFASQQFQEESSRRSRPSSAATARPRAPNPDIQRDFPMLPTPTTGIGTPAQPRPVVPSIPVDDGSRRRAEVDEWVRKKYAAAAVAADNEQIAKAVSRLVDRKALATPFTGVISSSFEFGANAPLEIKTSYGPNYFVKVVNWSDKSTVLTAFIRGGSPFECHLPIGSYEIRYATGHEWFGEPLDFGDQGKYQRCDDRFDFVRTADGYKGYTIELIIQQNGNLETEAMSPFDF